jgi:cytoskeletal protein CcmA (bactofilin family)
MQAATQPVIKSAKTMSDFNTPAPASAQKGPGVSIGRGIGFTGSIEGADTLTVETKVELSVKCRLLVVAEEGHYSGKVEAEIVEIRGRFDGEMTAKDRLIIHDKGAISGTIKYKEIEVARGATLTGNFDVLKKG